MLQSDEIREKVVLEEGILPATETLTLELEVVVDYEERLVWALWWLGGDTLLVTIPAPDA